MHLPALIYLDHCLIYVSIQKALQLRATRDQVSVDRAQVVQGDLPEPSKEIEEKHYTCPLF